MTNVVAVPVDPWTEAMRRGDFEAAWRVSDRIVDERAGKPCWDWPRHLQYIWDGRSIAGKRVLVRCYHGLGDTLQFIRFMPQLSEVASQVTVWVQPSLLPLLSQVKGVDRWMPLHDGVPDGDYEAEVELMEVPHALRTTLATLPQCVPYLYVDAACDVLREPPAALEVGVVWQSGDWDDRRSIGIEAVKTWSRIPGLRLHCLQRGRARGEWQSWLGPDSGSDDPWRAAQVMRALDLIITVDSMPAHLAGALGVPVWTLLHSDPDWRWMQHRTDSPWYPTMQLFRQREPGSWQPVIDRIGFELARRVRKAAHSERV